MPTIEAWLQGAVDDVTRSSQSGVRPVLEALAQSAAALRRANWNADATRDDDRAVAVAGSTPPVRRG